MGPECADRTVAARGQRQVRTWWPLWRLSLCVSPEKNEPVLLAPGASLCRTPHLHSSSDLCHFPFSGGGLVQEAGMTGQGGVCPALVTLPHLLPLGWYWC